jgi:hypothetical protein
MDIYKLSYSYSIGGKKSKVIITNNETTIKLSMYLRKNDFDFLSKNGMYDIIIYGKQFVKSEYHYIVSINLIKINQHDTVIKEYTENNMCVVTIYKFPELLKSMPEDYNFDKHPTIDFMGPLSKNYNLVVVVNRDYMYKHEIQKELEKILNLFNGFTYEKSD